jgi:putative ABC transport system substrate-binding protein
MQRRTFLGGSAATLGLSPLYGALAQQPGKWPVIGFLGSTTPAVFAPFVAAFREGLNKTGYVEGQNLAIEYRWAEDHYERLPELAASVIVVYGAPAIRAAQQATRTIPIVRFGDLLSQGLIGSLARPGGNTTGVSILNTDLDAKRLEVLKQIVPSGQRFALLRDPTFGFPAQMQAIAAVGHAIGVELLTADIRVPTDWRRPSRLSGLAALRRSTSPTRRCFSPIARSAAGSVQSISCRQSVSGERWQRRAAWQAMEPDYRKAGPCSPP